jgi:hypothetical protein
LQQTVPSQAAKEYLKILRLAAEEGETQVDEALRELLERKNETTITAAAVGDLLKRLDTVLTVTMVEVAAVDLASLDQLCTEMGVRQ